MLDGLGLGPAVGLEDAVTLGLVLGVVDAKLDGIEVEIADGTSKDSILGLTTGVVDTAFDGVEEAISVILSLGGVLFTGWSGFL